MICENMPQGLEKKIARLIAKIVIDFKLIEDKDRIMVAMSGGKDSLLLLHFLSYLRSVAPISFDIGVFHLNGSLPDYPAEGLMDAIAAENFEAFVENIDMASVFAEKVEPGASPCPLCSRLRRGILYTQARKLGFNKIALGHHRDDAIETFMMNAMYSGIIKSMPPKLVSDDGLNIVIRPMLAVPESLLVQASKYLTIPVLKQDFCKMERSGKRFETKILIRELEKENPKLSGNLFHALQHVVADHLLDPTLINRNDADSLF